MVTQQAEPLSAPGSWASQFIRGDEVNSEIYTSPEIFEREVQKIFHATWNYVAHESEIPNQGDFVTRVIGRQPVVVVRGDDGVCRILMNRWRRASRSIAVSSSAASIRPWGRCGSFSASPRPRWT